MIDKQQLAAMGEHLAEQQPLCMTKRIEELEAQVRVMAGLLREARVSVTADIALSGEGGRKEYPAIIAQLRKLVSDIDAALAGKLPDARAMLAAAPEYKP